MTRLADLVDAATGVAWLPFGNTANAYRYEARKQAFERLRDAVSRAPQPRTDEESAVVACSQRLAAHSGSNRWGPAYADRKQAMQQLRGALDVLASAAGALR